MAGVIILAAGGSVRMGRPKQNLVYKGKTLLQHAIDTALESDCGPIVVVLGANAAEITISQGIEVLHNPDWQSGMASSISLAVEHFEKHHEVDNLVIMLCDQPFVSSSLLNLLVQKQKEGGASIVCCNYTGVDGVPAVFNRTVFGELKELTGQAGAKQMLVRHQDSLERVAFDEGWIDIDTQADYEKLLNGSL